MRTLIIRFFILLALFFPIFAEAVTPMVVTGNFHTVALKADGTLLAWGDNVVGQLGDGTMIDHLSPVAVPGLTGVVAIAAGAYHTVALKADGTLWAWGQNNSGQLGNGTTTKRLSPVAVPGLTGVVAVTARSNRTVVLKADGTLLAWGLNNFGQLGDGTTMNRLSPVAVPGLTGVAGMATGYDHTVAVKADGTLRAWGRNDLGQLGDGTTTQRLSPVAVSGLTGVVAVAAGGSHTVAVKSDGTLRAWGLNHLGQLGDGTTTTRLSPVAVPGLTGVAAVAAGGSHTVALKTDGTLRAWGRNNSGQLGDGTMTDRLSPVSVPGMTGVVAVTARNDHTVALKANGTLRAWGENGTGQLGDCTTTARYSPTAVAGVECRGFLNLLDTTPPVISVSQTPLPNANGWNNTDVAINFTATDADSPPATCTVNSVTLTAVGAGQVVSTTCTDASGNSASASLTVNIDKTAPDVAGTRAPAANGWNNTDVTVTFTATDSLSGIRGAASADVLLSNEGAGQTASITFSDLASNSGSATVGDINIDKTAPVLTLPDFSGSYVFNSSLTLIFGATDALFNLATQSATLNGNSVNSGDTVLLSQLGTNTFTLTATDKAGNSVTETRQFAVNYAFGGFLSPLGGDRTVFRLGSTIPVKFKMFDANGVEVTTAIFGLSLQNLFNDEPVGTPIDATPPGVVDSDNLFRYSGGHYKYNLSTQPYSTGSWRIQVTLDDKPIQTIDIGLTSKP